MRQDSSASYGGGTIQKPRHGTVELKVENEKQEGQGCGLGCCAIKELIQWKCEPVLDRHIATRIV